MLDSDFESEVFADDKCIMIQYEMLNDIKITQKICIEAVSKTETNIKL